MIYWLILVMIAGDGNRSALLHVGNFKSYTQCQTAAKGATYPVWPTTSTAHQAFVCVQANQVGTSQPPD
jgi:hypothetical protein